MDHRDGSEAKQHSWIDANKVKRIDPGKVIEFYESQGDITFSKS